MVGKVGKDDAKEAVTSPLTSHPVEHMLGRDAVGGGFLGIPAFFSQARWEVHLPQKCPKVKCGPEDLLQGSRGLGHGPGSLAGGCRLVAV